MDFIKIKSLEIQKNLMTFFIIKTITLIPFLIK